MHTFSRTQTNPLLQDLMRENEVWVNAATAAAAGLKNGQYVRLKNQDGVDQQPDPGQGDAAHPSRLRLHGLRLRPHQQDAEERVPARGRAPAQLNTTYETDPLMGGTSIHGNFVTFVKEA